MKRFRSALALVLLAACSDSDSPPNVDPDGSSGPVGVEITSFSATGDGAGTLEIEFQWALDDPDGLVEACTLDPGDGSDDLEVDCAAGSATHRYATDGLYTARLTAAWSSGVTSAPTDVEVAPPAEFPIWAQQLSAEKGPVHGRGIDVDAEGNSVLVGSVGNGAVVEGAEASAGNDDLFVAKIAPDGSLLWLEQLGTAGDDVAVSVEVDAAGDAYVAGWAHGDLIEGDDVTYGAFVIKVGSGGEVLWRAQVGGDDGIAVALHEASGSVYVSGNSAYPIEGADGTGTGFVARLSTAGALSWVTQFEAIDEGIGQNTRGLAVDAAGNAYVTGWVATDFDDSTNQAFLVVVSGAGAVSSRQTFGAEGAADHGSAVAVSEDGVYVGGSTRGSFGGEYNNGWDSFVVAFDTAGAQRWAAQHSGDLDDFTHGLDIDASGNVYAVSERYADPGDNRAVVTSYQPDGTERWTGEVAGQRTSGYGVAVAPGGAVIVAGQTGASLDGESMAGGFVDAFAATVAPTL